MYCTRAYLKSVSICAIIFVGGLLYFAANFLSDRLGRRIMFRTSILLSAAGIVMLVLGGLFAAVGGMVLVALMVDVCNSLAFVYMSEVAPPKLRNVSSLAMLVASFLGEILGSFTALIFLDYRHMSLLYFGSMLPVFAFFFWLRPTFFHLVRSQDKAALLDQLRYVLRLNGVRPDYIKARLHGNRAVYCEPVSSDCEAQHLTSAHKRDLVFDNCSIESQASKTSEDGSVKSLEVVPELRLFELTQEDLEPLFVETETADADFVPLRKYFSQCGHVLNLVAYVFLVLNLFWVKGMTVLLPEKMGFDSVYLNNFLLSAADLIGISVMACFLNNTRRTQLNRFHLGFILASSSVVVAVQMTPLRASVFGKFLDVALSCKSLRNSRLRAHV